MKASADIRGDTVVIRVNGSMTLSDEIREFQSSIDVYLAQGYRKFIFNMAEVPRVDSAGLGTIFQAWIRVKNHGGLTVLVGVQQEVKNLLVITKLLTVVEIADSEADAEKILASVSGVESTR